MRAYCNEPEQIGDILKRIIADIEEKQAAEDPEEKDK